MLNTKFFNVRNKMFFALGINLLIIVFEIVALIQTVSFDPSGYFTYYTQDSNLLAWATSLIFIVTMLIQFFVYKKSEIPHWLSILKYVSTTCLALTFIVVITVLGPIYESQQAGAYWMFLTHGSMLYHHFLCPVLSIISYVLFEVDLKTKFKETLYPLIPTFIYAIIIISLVASNLITAPYPFLEVNSQPVYMSIIWIIVIIGGDYGISCLLYLPASLTRRKINKNNKNDL
jgi:hypothetical protein